MQALVGAGAGVVGAAGAAGSAAAALMFSAGAGASGRSWSQFGNQVADFGNQVADSARRLVLGPEAKYESKFTRAQVDSMIAEFKELSSDCEDQAGFLSKHKEVFEKIENIQNLKFFYLFDFSILSFENKFFS